MYRDRRCEGCGSLFVATPKDVRERVFACKECRGKELEPTREGIVRSRADMATVRQYGEMKIHKIDNNRRSSWRREREN